LHFLTIIIPAVQGNGGTANVGVQAVMHPVAAAIVEVDAPTEASQIRIPHPIKESKRVIITGEVCSIPFCVSPLCW